MGMFRNVQQSLDLIGSMANGGTLSAFIDAGPTIENIVLETDLAAAEFTLIIEVDGERRVEITGTQMNQREAYDGFGATSTVFEFAFSDQTARKLEVDAMTALCTAPGQRVKVSLELAASGIAGTETVTMYLETSPYRKEEFRLYVLPEPVKVSQTGENTFDGFRRGRAPGRTYIRRVFNYGAITKLSVEQDDRYIFGKKNLSKTINDARLKRNGKTVPSSCYVFDPVVLGNGKVDLLDTFSIEYLRFTYTTSDSNDITALTEYVVDVRSDADRAAAAARAA